ncbi:MAG: enoyl-CoA hydratase/isomerase family protein [Actinomycetota bacterium]|nr:enoyl-CoA hydratase/isomerase family protein [Acidimicrobiia bacterium]MDQ3293540.1 enoyl-CoA hydratase/isomerase family protein [Actinomycetota bacterium]
MGEHMRVDEDGPVLTVTFTRLEKRNAVSDEMFDALRAALRSMQERADLRVLVLTGEGEWFTAGLDLQGGFARGLYEPAEHQGQAFRQRYRQLHLLFDDIEATEKPVVLAAQGPCFGVGLELACSCDIRVASTTTTFSLPEVRFGAVAGSGGTTRLTRIVGPSWAKWVAMAGQTIDADRALQIGLVQEVVAPERFTARVRELAADLATIPAEGMGLAKLLVDAAVDLDRTTARHLDRIAVTGLYDTGTVAEHRQRFE